MKVKEIMTTEPRTCSPDTTLAAAAQLMWNGDCGILPVVRDGSLVGVVTDRDMYIALATRNALASSVPVEAVATKAPVTCEPEDDVLAALALMKQARVRRLPVVGFAGIVLGILSIDDILHAAGAEKPIRPEQAVDALQAICGHHQPVARIVTV